MLEQRRREMEEAYKRNIEQLHPIQAELMHIVQEHDEPVRNTTLAHAFARIAGYRNREERDGWIKKAWRHLAALLRKGKLQWSAKRKHVEVAPQEKHEAWLARNEQKIASLPKPRIGRNGPF